MYLLKEQKTSPKSKPKLKLTAWFRMPLLPERAGWYDACDLAGNMYADRLFFEDGEFWKYGIFAQCVSVRQSLPVSKWRGVMLMLDFSRVTDISVQKHNQIRLEYNNREWIEFGVSKVQLKLLEIYASKSDSADYVILLTDLILKNYTLHTLPEWLLKG